MRKISIAIIISIFFIRCTPEDKKIPAEILPLDSMKIIVWNLIEAGDYATSLKEKDTTIKSLNTKYFTEVLKLHHINKDNFLKSFNFYQTHPFFNNVLFDSVNAYASRQRNQIYKQRQ
jgi:Domain of unknown function (DUF4296)